MNKRFKKSRPNKTSEDTLITAIKMGNLEVVQNIANKVGLNFSKLWLSGYALLCIAINYRRHEIALWLLAKNCLINHDDDLSKTPLYLAIMYNDNSLVELLLNKGACITTKNVEGETALHISCKNQNLIITQLLLKDDTIIDVSDNHLITPLHIAVEQGCLEIIKLLLNHKVNINAHTMKPGYEGFTALHMAVVKENNDVVKILLENKANINAVVQIPQIDESLENNPKKYVCYQSYTPLHLAIVRKNDNIINSLLHHNADVNAIIEYNGFTPLHIAIQNKDTKNFWLLLKHNANFNIKTRNGQNILHFALENDWSECVKDLIVKKLIDINAQTNTGETLLFLAVEMGDEEWIGLLLKNNANVNVSNSQKQNPLHIAAKFSGAIVKILLINGAKVDEIDANNETSLSIAVKLCNVDVIKVILHYQPSSVNTSNKSAFVYAINNINYNFIEVVQILIDYGFLIDDENISMDSLKYLISIGELKILEYLLNHTDVCIKNQKESCLLHQAVKHENIVITELLIKHGFDLNILDIFGKSAIDYAIEYEYSDILDILLGNGAKINNFTFAFLCSAKNNNISLFQTILNFGGNVCVSDEFGTTPLHFATWNEDYEFVIFLLNEKASINTTTNGFDQIINTNISSNNSDSYTKEFKRQIFTSPLHIAVSKKDIEICTMFLECHANVNSKDGYGRTPLHIAAAMKSSDQNKIVKILLNYGADINILDDFKRLPIYYIYNHSCVCSIAFQNQYNFYSECECDLYEETEVNNVITTYVKHIVLLTNMNKTVCTENYNIIINNDFSKNLQISCYNELFNMKEKKLCDHVSIYDIISKRSNILIAYICDEAIIEAFEAINCVEEFPLYCDIIKERFDKAQERKYLLDRAVSSFSSLINFSLPQFMIENIFNVLLLNDLKNIIAAYNHNNL